MKSELSTVNVFVYGTLKPGEANYLVYCDGNASERTSAYVKGILYDLPVGYPAMTEGREKVRGVLLKFKDANVLASLDRLEDYQPARKPELNLYYRQLTAVYDQSDRAFTQAWAYYMTPTQVKQHQGKKLTCGYWTKTRTKN